MPRLIIYAVGLLFSVVAMICSDLNSGWFAVSSGFAIGFAIPLLDTLIANFPFLRIVGYSLRTWRQRVRISASYLYRIRLGNEYLLIKGERFDQYQPVGGVYKTHPSSLGQRNYMNILDDNLLDPDPVSEGDLRVRVPGKHLVSFVRWFEKGRGRETDCWREFYEELIATGILPAESFRVIKYDRIERRYQRMRFSKWAQSQELLIADILDLLPTPQQITALEQLKERSDPRVLWAPESQIRRLGATDGAANQTTRIAQTAVWTIDASQ